MISLDDVVNDADLAQPFTINRSTGSFQLGGFKTAVTQVQSYGIITVAKDQDLQMLPEGDRVSGAMLFHSSTRIYLTEYDPADSTQHVSDIILWHNQQYRILYIAPWDDYGYWRATGVRMAGR